MSIKSERARATIALLSAASEILTQAEGEGRNEEPLLMATNRAKKLIEKEMSRQLNIYDANRG